MAIQTYVKKSSSSTFSATVTAAGVDGVLFTLIHEWGDPVLSHTKVASAISAGDTSITVVDGSSYSVNDYILLLDSRNEVIQVDSIDGNVITLVTAVIYNHNSGIQTASLTDANYSDPTGSYTFTATELSSSGQHKIKWFTKDGSTVSFKSDSIFTVYQQYIDKPTFFAYYPELEVDFDETFDAIERKVRGIIGTYCGQYFDYYTDKSLIIEGSGRNTLHLISRLERFTTVLLKDDLSDITNLVDYDPYSKFYLRLTGTAGTTIPPAGITSAKSKWGANSDFEILGDWGWEQVPENITQAAAILVADQMNDDSQYTKHGVVDASFDTHRMKFDSVILGTTGNLDADTLLMDYTLFVLGEI